MPTTNPSIGECVTSRQPAVDSSVQLIPYRELEDMLAAVMDKREYLARTGNLFRPISACGLPTSSGR